MERSRDWLAQAQRDLEKARLDLRHEYFEWACFTAHQAAEKAVKAVFQARGSSVRGHALLRLLQDLEPRVPVSDDLKHAARVLDRYYIEARYPNGFPSGSPMEYFDAQLANEAVDAAQEILRFCTDHLG
jgi:HEPN domain-containing protein